MIDGFKLADGHADHRPVPADADTTRSHQSLPGRQEGNTGEGTSLRGLALMLNKAANAPIPGPAANKRTRNWRSEILAPVLGAAALVIMMCWGAWMTKAILDLEGKRDRLVKMELQGVIAEYLQAQARSGSDERSAAEATTAFMSELDKAITALGKSGRIVLVNEAVIGGEVPDVTDAIRKTVYTHVPMPKVAAVPVQQDMQAYLAAGSEGTNGAAGRNAQ